MNRQNEKKERKEDEEVRKGERKGSNARRVRKKTLYNTPEKDTGAIKSTKRRFASTHAQKKRQQTNEHKHQTC